MLIPYSFIPIVDSFPVEYMQKNKHKKANKDHGELLLVVESKSGKPTAQSVSCNQFLHDKDSIPTVVPNRLEILLSRNNYIKYSTI